MIKIKNKKAQEEIVGFVLVVVIIAVVFLIFLGIMLRQKNNVSQESVDIRHFLMSASELTTSCSFDGYHYENMRDLFGECYQSNKNCDSGQSPCKVLNDTLNGMLDSSFVISSDSLVKGYSFSSVYSRNLSLGSKEIILEINKGSCNSTIQGADDFFSHREGVITNTLSVCS